VANKDLKIRLGVEGGEKVAAEMHKDAEAVKNLQVGVTALGEAEVHAGGNGKVLVETQKAIQGETKKSSNELKQNAQATAEAGSAAQGASRLIKGLRDSFAEMTVYTGAAYKALKLWAEGAREARKEASEEVSLRVAVVYTGETPEQAGERFEKVRKKAERIALDLGLDPGQMKKDVASVIDSPKAEAGILTGGLGTVGATLGVETGMGAAGGMSYLKRSAKIWNTGYDEPSMRRQADILKRYSKAANVAPSEFADVMEKMGLSFAAAGARPEDAALLAASLMAVKPKRAGFALESFAETVGAAAEDPKKRAMMKRAGLNLFDKSGNLLGADEMQKKFDAFLKKEKNPLKRKAALADAFGPAGADIGYLFETGAIAETRGTVDQKGGIGGRIAAEKQTSDYWLRRGKFSLGEGVASAFAYPEKMLTRIGSWAVPNVVEPAQEFLGSKPGQYISNGLLLGAGAVAAGFGVNALRKAIKSRGGLAGMWAGAAGEAADTASGVGKGIAVAALTGGRVQPVFVTNWPSGQTGPASLIGPTGPTGPTTLAGPGVMKRAAASITAWGGSSVIGAGAGSILGATAIGLAGGAAIGYGINRLTMESKSEKDAVRKSTIYDRLAGGGAETGEHQINMVQAGMAHVLAFFGDKNSARFLAEREELKKGGDADSSAKAGDAAVAQLAAAREQAEAARLANETSANLAAAITEFRQASAYIARGR